MCLISIFKIEYHECESTEHLQYHAFFFLLVWFKRKMEYCAFFIQLSGTISFVLATSPAILPPSHYNSLPPETETDFFFYGSTPIPVFSAQNAFN